MMQLMRNLRLRVGRDSGLAILAFIALVKPAGAADLLEWTGAAGDMTWETAGNWKNVTTGANPALAAPGDDLVNPTDVVVPANSGTVNITDDTQAKHLHSLDLKPTDLLTPTVLTTSVEAATGRGRDLNISTVGTIPGETIGIRIGAKCVVGPASSVAAGPRVPLRDGGSMRLVATGGKIVIEGPPSLTVLEAGNGAPSPSELGGGGGDPAPGADQTPSKGGNLDLIAKSDVSIGGVVRGGRGGVAGSSGSIGGGGGAVWIWSSEGGILITVTAGENEFNVRGGDGGVGFMNGAEGVGGPGGTVDLFAQATVDNKGKIRGGHGAAGLAEGPFPDSTANGGNVAILAGGLVDNRLGIAGGNGYAAGGRLVLFAKSVLNRTKAEISGGNALGSGTRRSAGIVVVAATGTIENQAGASILGGRGAPVGAAPDSVPPGRGGEVRLTTWLAQPGDIQNAGNIRGGAAGFATFIPPAGILIGGAKVTLSAKNKITLDDASLIEGGPCSASDPDPSVPSPQKPRGDVIVMGKNIKGVAGGKLAGNRIKGTAENPPKPPPQGGGRGKGSPEPEIDFSGALSHSIEGEELVCFDAGPDGDINLSCAATDAIVAGNPKRGIRGQIHILAGDIQVDSCTKEPLTLEQITSPDATVEVKLCECCDIECPADLDHDGDVDGIDLALLLGGWSACPTTPGPCLADLDADGFVDSGDLAILLAAWGPCL